MWSFTVAQSFTQCSFMVACSVHKMIMNIQDQFALRLYYAKQLNKLWLTFIDNIQSISWTGSTEEPRKLCNIWDFINAYACLSTTVIFIWMNSEIKTKIANLNDSRCLDAWTKKIDFIFESLLYESSIFPGKGGGSRDKG